MHESDIARTRNQVGKVADKAQAIVDEVETLETSGFTPTDSQTLQAKQQALVSELAQALADFNELTNRAEVVETESITYAPASVFTFQHDADTQTLTIEYTGAVELTDATVTKAGTDITPFSLPLTGGETATVDTSTLTKGDSVTVTYPSTRQKTPIPIGSWEEITGQPAAPEIQIGGIELPSHNLVAETKDQTDTYTHL